MARARTIEILVGAFVAVGCLALFLLAMKVSNLSATSAGEGYRLIALFDNVGSLKERAPVSIAGVRIGRVEAIRFDPEAYRAAVTLRIDQAIDTIPVDSIAGIYTAGLLGEQYVGLEPGGSEEHLRNGDQIAFTQAALVLEQMVSQLLFSNPEETSE